ncbi:MAG: FCD domain-containing protein [Sulfitobacter sp.]
MVNALTDNLTTGDASSARIVDEALAALLARPEMGPGSKLPTERLLAEELCVPRSAVRNGMARLEILGKVIRKMGSGTYVTPLAEKNSGRRGSNDASPLEIMQTRLLIEPTLASLIVANGNAADLEKIKKAMMSAEAATDFSEFEEWDARFHQALADATQNRLMVQVYGTITTSRDLAEWGDLKKQSLTEERRCIYNEEHARIYNALHARNMNAARDAISAHLITVRHNLLGI